VTALVVRGGAAQPQEGAEVEELDTGGEPAYQEAA